jgi:hypothetical protein
MATLECKACDYKLFCDECFTFLHRKGPKKEHESSPISGGVVKPQQTSSQYRQQAATTKRALEKAQRELDKAAVLHFPEHSVWKDGMRRLARSNLEVARTLADDYEVIEELFPGGGARAGGQGRVLKVKLLGQDVGAGGAGAGNGNGNAAGEFKVLKELRQADIRVLLKEALIPHLLQVCIYALCPRYMQPPALTDLCCYPVAAPTTDPC